MPAGVHTYYNTIIVPYHTRDKITPPPPYKVITRIRLNIIIKIIR